MGVKVVGKEVSSIEFKIIRIIVCLCCFVSGQIDFKRGHIFNTFA